MKTLFECIEQINESFSSSILKEIASDFKKRGLSFRKVMQDNYILNVWDSIDDSEIEKETNITDACKRIRKQLRKDIPGKDFCLIIGYNDGMPDVMTMAWYDSYVFNERERYSRIPKYSHIDGERSIISMYQVCDVIYFIPVKCDEINKIRSDRAENRRGSINFDEQSFAEIAKENVKRYKSIIAKNKADKVNVEVKELIARLSEATSKLYKAFEKALSEPILNASKLTFMQYTLTEYTKRANTSLDYLIYDEKNSQDLNYSANFTAEKIERRFVIFKKDVEEFEKHVQDALDYK